MGNTLPWTAPHGTDEERLFYHFYAMPHLTRAHVDGFRTALAAAVRAPSPSRSRRPAGDTAAPGPPGELRSCGAAASA
ncbi:hypothetical protein SHKM778_47940 [Streptomyces sp. KM77-8]|uniref:Uncharacterized protein n=1 Tax=Streptomyces haneummycinicus TaxID=3074435 RepID=A0AAT9HME8_9ACTN